MTLPSKTRQKKTTEEAMDFNPLATYVKERQGKRVIRKVRFRRTPLACLFFLGGPKRGGGTLMAFSFGGPFQRPPSFFLGELGGLKLVRKHSVLKLVSFFLRLLKLPGLDLSLRSSSQTMAWQRQRPFCPCGGGTTGAGSGIFFCF